jgi:hypothetical protein
MAVRPAAVAGLFYPADPHQLRSLVRRLLDAVPPPPPAGEPPAALIVPHAGYQYSGPVAAHGYAWLVPWRGRITDVLLVGPAHFAAFPGLAASSASAFRTPLGTVPVVPLPSDAGALGIQCNDGAHAREHCLEVQLPFLAETLGEVPILPLLTGEVSAAAAARAILALSGPGTLVVVSSDLSHYLPCEEARRRDGATSAAIARGDAAAIRRADACGHTAVQALLLAAAELGLHAELADLRNSGDTGGGSGEVVGYGAFVFNRARASAPGTSARASVPHQEEDA